MATTISPKKQSAPDEPEWPAFFVPPVGFIQYVNPYAILGISEDTLQPEIASAVATVDGVNDTSRIEYVAAVIVSDPVRRLVWHCLRWPTEPPSAWAFMRRYGRTPIEGNIAAYLLHEAVMRELQGLRGDALLELWLQVSREFVAFLANPRLQFELSTIAARWRIDSPTLLIKVIHALEDTVPAIHAALATMSKDKDLQRFHWSFTTTPNGNTRLLDACLSRMRTRKEEKAKKAHKEGNIIAGLQQHIKIASAFPETDPREKRRLLFEIGENLSQLLMRHAVPTTPHELEEIINFLRALGGLTAFDSRLLSTIATFHAYAAESAAKTGDFRGATIHLLRAALCDPERPFELDRSDDDTLRVTAAGVTWSINPPYSMPLLATLQDWIAALEAGQPMLEGVFDRELRQLAEWVDLVTRLDLTLPNDKAIAAASTFLVELSAREPNEPFSATKARILSTMPEFRDIPWAAIEALDTQGTVLFPELLTNALPKPPPALDLQGKIRADVKRVRQSLKTLADYASSDNWNFRAGRATFFWSWFFADLHGSRKEIIRGLGLALITPFALVGMAGSLALALLSIVTFKIREGAELLESFVKCIDSIFDATRAWFAFTPDNQRDERPTYGLAKFQGAVGVVLLVVGLVYFVDKFGRNALQTYQRDRAYTAVCNAAATKDMSAVTKAARDFLNVTPSDKFDYRTLDVLEKQSEALVREIARAARERRSADMDQLATESTSVQKRTQAEQQAWKEIEAAQ